jgi:hypothetical protein
MGRTPSGTDIRKGWASEASPATATRQTSLVTGTAFAGKTGGGPAPDKPKSDDARPSDSSVWVVDGQPRYHRETCQRIEGLDAEAVPYAQAVEDGFVECESCQRVVNEVWVVDGRPEYHVEDCAHLTDVAGETIPRAQAVEDGFTPCADCRPDGSATATAPPQGDDPASGQPASEQPASGQPASDEPVERRSAAAHEVWVVDGRPRYHLQDCLTIDGQSVQRIPLDQATEDGFMPCSMCEPNVTRV